MTKILCLFNFHAWEYEENILTGKRFKVCRDCGVNREARFGWNGGVMTEQEIKDRAPDGSTHYYTIMFLGLVYIKYISGHPYYFHEQTRLWTKCNSFFEAKPL